MMNAFIAFLYLVLLLFTVSPLVYSRQSSSLSESCLAVKGMWFYGQIDFIIRKGEMDQKFAF